MTDSQKIKDLSTQVDELFADWDRPDSPGAAVIVLRDGDVVHRAGYGCAQLEYGIPITPETIFHVASVSKQFTCMAITLLARRGEISLDDDIRRYLPEVHDFGPTITVRHLAHHVSGLRDQWELLRLAGWRMDDVITTEHIMKMVKHQRELNFAPGEEHLYSNTGYTLLAEIVSRVTGVSLREFAHTNIFEPLGMESTHFHNDHREIVKNRAYSYSLHREGGFEKSVLSYANIGATSLFTTVEDLGRWLMNFSERTVGDEAVMETMNGRFELNSGDTIDYAFGLRFSRYRGLQVIGHSGSDAGFRSFCGRFPEHGLAVAVLSNLGSVNPQGLSMKIADLYLQDHMEPPETAEETADAEMPDEADLQDCTGTYLLSPLGMIEVIMDEKGLTLHQGQGPPRELIPVGGLRFRSEPLDHTIYFVRDEDGDVSALKLVMSGRTITAERLEPLALPPEELADYEGSYASDELGTVYTMVVEDGQLVMKHRRHEDAPLAAVSEDAFHSRWGRPGRVDFDREDGCIAGFRITGGRVRNLAFERQSG